MRGAGIGGLYIFFGFLFCSWVFLCGVPGGDQRVLTKWLDGCGVRSLSCCKPERYLHERAGGWKFLELGILVLAGDFGIAALCVLANSIVALVALGVGVGLGVGLVANAAKVRANWSWRDWSGRISGRYVVEL